MIEFEKAVKHIARRARRLPSARMKIGHAAGFCLAQNVRTPISLPRFDASAVDGYAIRSQDVVHASRSNPVRLEVSGTQQAARARKLSLGPNQAIRIMTGGALPAGADAVVMQERSVRKGGEVILKAAVQSGENVRWAGAEFAQGKLVLNSGMIISPPVLAMLATVGRTSVRVFRKPSVALIVSGSELRARGSRLRHGEIYDSNSPALIAALASIGITPSFVARVSDEKTKLRLAIRHALHSADIVITSGGISVGDCDFVKEISRGLGVREIFRQVAMKPGKPNFFGVKGRKLFFGLPGNPVASLLSFELLVRPAITRMMGVPFAPQLWIRARLGRSVRKKPGRVEFLRGIVHADAKDNLVVAPSTGQGSHMIGGLAKANCLIRFPEKAGVLKSGAPVSISLLHWTLPQTGS
jgi:molybdopterin molybdotransferase